MSTESVCSDSDVAVGPSSKRLRAVKRVNPLAQDKMAHEVKMHRERSRALFVSQEAGKLITKLQADCATTKIMPPRIDAMTKKVRERLTSESISAGMPFLGVVGLDDDDELGGEDSRSAMAAATVAHEKVCELLIKQEGLLTALKGFIIAFHTPTTLAFDLAANMESVHKMAAYRVSGSSDAGSFCFPVDAYATLVSKYFYEQLALHRLPAYLEWGRGMGWWVARAPHGTLETPCV